jgi:hypothetical protein
VDIFEESNHLNDFNHLNELVLKVIHWRFQSHRKNIMTKTAFKNGVKRIIKL